MQLWSLIKKGSYSFLYLLASIFKHFYECPNEKLRHRYAICISHFKAFGMINLQYEIIICQKIYDRVKLTEKFYYWKWGETNFTLTTVYIRTLKFLLTFIISLMRENLSKIFLTSLDRIYLLWRVTRVDRDIWNHKILHELLNLISVINQGSHLFFFQDRISSQGYYFFISF